MSLVFGRCDDSVDAGFEIAVCFCTQISFNFFFDLGDRLNSLVKNCSASAMFTVNASV